MATQSRLARVFGVTGDVPATRTVPDLDAALGLVRRLGGAIVSIPSMSSGLEALASTTLTRWLFSSGGTAMDLHGRIASDDAFSRINKYSDFFTTSAAEAIVVFLAFATALSLALFLLLALKLAAAGKPGRSRT